MFYLIKILLFISLYGNKMLSKRQTQAVRHWKEEIFARKLISFNCGCLETSIVRFPFIYHFTCKENLFCCSVVEHNCIMATYLVARGILVFEGQPSVNTIADTPKTLLAGTNLFWNC